MLHKPQVALNYTDQGAAGGPALVLSNSLGAALEMWAPQVEFLLQHFRLIRYDTRGHGKSSVPPAPYSMADLGGDVLRLLDALGVERAHFCGLSLGGTTGIWLGAHAPDRVARLVLCNTAPFFGPPAVFDARIESVLRQGLPALVEGILQRWFTAEFRAAEPDAVAGIEATLLTTPVAGYVGCCAALRDVDERQNLARIRAPTLVIGGTFDPAPTIHAARSLAAAIPGAEFAELPTAHLSNLGAATQFNARVLEFLTAR